SDFFAFAIGSLVQPILGIAAAIAMCGRLHCRLFFSCNTVKMGGFWSGMSEGAPPSGDDNFAPPKDPCECYCLHCGRVFMSDQIWFQKVIGARDGFPGFWMCPTP